MMLIRRFLQLTLAYTVLICTSQGQIQLDSFSANVGFIKSTHSDFAAYSDYDFALYPELQISGSLLHPFFKFGVYWGYWNDGIEEPLDFADVITYSWRTHILGARLTFLPSVIFPIGIFGGYAHHFSSVRYVGGHDFEGKPGRSFYQEMNTLELGVTADVSIFGPVGIRGEANQYFPLGARGTDEMQKGRWALKLGVALRL